jgi:hypothetical protein
MTATEEVPMPEPDRGTILVGREEVSLGHSDEAMRAYAGARCAELEAVIHERNKSLRKWADWCKEAEAERDALAAKTACTLGVGDGSGSLFVHGDYASIKAAQAIILERDALAEKCRAMEDNDRRYRWLREMQCCSATVSKNDGHAPNYMSLTEWIESSPDLYKDVPLEELERMKETGTDWAIQVYPNTPVGFNLWHASTLDAAIDAASGGGE